jgi:hypothetical protein
MSASLRIETEHTINPLDVLEQIIAGNEWVFERRSDHEMAAEAPGKWCDYGLHFSWSAEMSVMSFTCAFDLKVPAARREKLYELLALANDLLHLLAHSVEGDVECLKCLGSHTFTLMNQSQKDVFGSDVVVVEQARLFLGKHHHATRSVSKPLEHDTPPTL